MARRRKNRKERLMDGVIRFTVCGLLLASVLIGLRFLSDIVESLSPKEEVVEEQVPVVYAQNTEVETQEEEGLKVCIDAGHGGKDVGTDHKGRYEKDDNLKVALELQKYLESQNIKVVMTRKDDTFLKLSKRVQIANDAKVDYFISIHRNSGEGNGIESWLYNNAGKENIALAESIMKGMNEVGVSRDRGISYGTAESATSNYYVNANSKAPSIIIEMGFINSSEDNTLLDTNGKAYAKAIGDAIITTYDKYKKKDTK